MRGVDKAESVWIIELDYIEEDIFNAQRYFDRNNNPVSAHGTPLPERPANVPAHAHLIRVDYSNVRWGINTISLRIGNYIGEYKEWDLGGRPVWHTIRPIN